MPKIAQLTAARTIVIKDRPPLIAKANEVIIGVTTAGVCGTDLALFSGDYPVPLPLVCGHEFVGTVQSVGDGVDKKWLGRRITAEINNTCKAYNRSPLCQACITGMPAHCLKRTVTGIINHDGAFAEEVAVAQGTLHEIPDGMDPEVAALKGCRVIAVSRSEAKRERSLAFGASQALSPEQAENTIKEITGGLGADIVIDATGQPDGITKALSLVRPRGILSVKTTCGLPAQGLDMTKLVVDEIRLQGSRCGPFGPALKILEEHQEKLKKLITSTRPLAEAQQALESAYRENKVLIRMG